MPQVRHDTPLAVWPGGAYEAGEVLRVAPKASIAEYSWDELACIARAIAAAGCRTEGLTIARMYGLVDKDGRLWDDDEHIKPLTLQDGTRTGVRILGFCHDKLADGTGRAGISFEFADVPMRRRMNPGRTNEGGWHKSEMRDWLNTVFWGMLPQDLSSNIVEVEKRTHYSDWNKGGSGEAFHVTGTFDKLWLLSMTEVYGRLSVHKRNVPRPADVYDAEGSQYQLYADNAVSVANYGFCQKRGANSWWWLRSPRADDSFGFHFVSGGGVWGAGDADDDWGVSPGFCF